MGNLNPTTTWGNITGERMKKINLTSPNGASINYAHLMVDTVLKRCELFFSLSYPTGLAATTHHSVLSIPNEYLPVGIDVQSAGTAGASGWIQISIVRNTKTVSIWGLEMIVTPRGQMFWYYG